MGAGRMGSVHQLHAIMACEHACQSQNRAPGITRLAALCNVLMEQRTAYQASFFRHHGAVEEESSQPGGLDTHDLALG